MSSALQISTRPNRISDTKDETYHSKFCRFYLGQASDWRHNKWLEKIKRHKEFYKGNQWEKEDIDSFLTDESGEVATRMRIVQNTIRPLVENYRGNSILLNMNASARSISPRVKTRMDQALEEKMFMTRLQNEIPTFSEGIRKNFNVGKTSEETYQIFINEYVDNYSEMITHLIQHIAKENDLTKKQLKMAENLAFSGAVVMHHYNHGTFLKTTVLESERFFFDRNARESDLKDASFMGHWSLLDPSSIFESFQDIKPEDRLNIERFVANGGVSAFNSTSQSDAGRIAVYTCFWIDIQQDTWGYIQNKYGYLELQKINYTYPGETEPRYTDKDVVTPPDTAEARKLGLNASKKTRKSVYDVLRYCYLIPSECIATQSTPSNELKDIVLEYGVYQYQGERNEKPNNITFPYSISTWAYIDGEIVAPIEDAIDPQKMINRINSVVESQLNNSGGSSFFYDESAVDDEIQFLSDMKNGRPVKVTTKGRGVPNMVQKYDNNVPQGTYSLFNIINGYANMIQQATGVNEALRGESMGSEQLVGVTKMLLQRGSLMQEPFYNAIQEAYISAMDYYAHVGRDIFIENEREFAIRVGDDFVKVAKLDKDIQLEDMRIFVSRENTNEMLMQQADSMLMQLYQAQLIDDKILADLFGRSTPFQVGTYLRRFAKEKAMVAIKSAEINKQKEVEAKAKVAEDMNTRLAEYAGQRNIDASVKEREIAAKSKLKTDEMITGKAIEDASQRIPM
jgi:hypothetical protein